MDFFYILTESNTPIRIRLVIQPKKRKKILSSEAPYKRNRIIHKTARHAPKKVTKGNTWISENPFGIAVLSETVIDKR